MAMRFLVLAEDYANDLGDGKKFAEIYARLRYDNGVWYSVYLTLIELYGQTIADELEELWS